MSETEKIIFDEIKKDNYIRANTIAEKINKSEKTVYRTIKKLKDLDFVMRNSKIEGGTNEYKSL